jgi:hypothetical protein
VTASIIGSTGSQPSTWPAPIHVAETPVKTHVNHILAKAGLRGPRPGGQLRLPDRARRHALG